MNTTDFDPKKFSRDSHGNLIPKENNNESINRPRPRNKHYVSPAESAEHNSEDTATK